MNDRIRQILTQITSLEDEPRSVLHEQERRMHYQIKDKRIESSAPSKQPTSG